MGSQEWYVAWVEPATVALSCDHASRASFGFKVGDTGVVQIALGQDARVEIETEAGVREWSGSDLPAGLIEGVLRLRSLAPEPVPQPAPEPDVDETALTPQPAAAKPSAAEPPLDFDETALTPRPAAAKPSAAEPPLDFDETVLTPRASAAAPPPDFDETVLTPRSSAPVLDVTAPAYDALITDADGARLLAVDGALYVGRAPAVPNERGARPGDLAFVASRTDHVSGTHLTILDDDGLLLVRDLWSTNGTEVLPVSGGPYRLAPGEWLPVTVGTRLRLADDVTVEVAGATPVAPTLAGAPVPSAAPVPNVAPVQNAAPMQNAAPTQAAAPTSPSAGPGADVDTAAVAWPTPQGSRAE